MDKRCKTCVWYEASVDSRISDGLCRKRPPYVDQTPDPCDYGVWPMVRGEVDWCSEHTVSIECVMFSSAKDVSGGDIQEITKDE